MTQDNFLQLSLDSPMNYEKARTNMLKQQIRTWDVLDDKILSLFYAIPREDFVPPSFKPLAFADIFIPLAHGQKMMSPKEEGRILQELKITPNDKVLVLGMDSGFLVTLLAKLAKQVYYIDNDIESSEKVKNKCIQYHLTNVICSIGNIHQGWQDVYPFEVIVLTGSLPWVPETLKQALVLQGRLFVVVGNLPIMEATIITRLSENTWKERKLFETVRPRLLDTKENNSFKF
jgi:protein-L-isoaspartate(D-aspartate) O-methyltransferase